MGECALDHLARERGVRDRIEIDSAGTHGYHTGELPDSRMRSAASARGYELTGAARKVVRADLDRFDLVVAMDRDNESELHELGDGSARIRLLSDFLPEGSPVDVPDPYYGGGAGFDRVIDMVEEAAPAILDELLGG